MKRIATIAALLLLATTSCESERGASLRAFGGWIARDAGQFADTITGAPDWIATSVRHDAQALSQSLGVAVRRTGEDATYFAQDVTGAPAWLGNHVQNGVAGMEGDVVWFAHETERDAAAFSEDVTGAPGWIARQSATDMHGLLETFGMIFERIGREFVEFPTNMLEGLHAVLFR
ncbi:MAG TPA: hypothetical protein VKE69_07900 [Planctomycetota bacterium]|nr:hypothetical protein [Planctomycetota bacterium]